MPLPGQRLQIHVVVHAVDGLAPGAYRHDLVNHTPQVRRAGIDLRRAARGAAQDQDVIGDAAVVFALALERRAVWADLAGHRRAPTGTRYCMPAASASAPTSRPARAVWPPVWWARSATPRPARWWQRTRCGNGSCTSPRWACRPLDRSMVTGGSWRDVPPARRLLR